MAAKRAVAERRLGFLARDHRERLDCRDGEGGAFAFSPFPSYLKSALRRTPGAVKGARCWRVHRSAAKTLDGEDGCINWQVRERGCGRVNRDRGKPRSFSPPTPPDMRVRIRRFGGVSHQRTVNLGIPSESK